MTISMRTKLSTTIAALTLASTAQAGMLADLYQQARNYDAQLLSAQANANAGGLAADIALSYLKPNVSLTGNSQKGNGSDISNGATLSLEQPLFNLQSIYGYEQAQTLTEQAKLGLSVAEQGLIVRVVNAYLDILSAQATLEVAESRERALSRRLDQVNAQFDVGLIAITDVLEARASYDDARVGLIDAKGALANSYEAMERISGSAVNSVDPLSADYPITGLSISDTEQWVAKALSGNLGLKSAYLSEQAANQNLEVKRAASAPTLSFSASLNAGNDQFMARSSDSSFGLRFSLPIFNGSRFSSEELKAAYEAEKKAFDYDDTLREVTQNTRSLVRDIETSVASVDARMKSIESRETALEATEQGFEVGTRNVVDVLDAENALYVARQNYVDSRLGHIKLQFALKQTIGTLSQDDLATLDNWLK